MSFKSLRTLLHSTVAVAALLGAQVVFAGAQDAKDSFNQQSTPNQPGSGTQSPNINGMINGNGHGNGNGHPPVTSAVPEPETYAMMLVGLGLMGAIVRRRNKSGSR
jgi:PEP-CTERM motif